MKKTLAIFLCAFALSGCERTLSIFRTYEPSVVIQPQQPKPVIMHDVKFRVVTKDNLDQFLQELEKEQVEVVWIAITPDDYERLALNLSELRRYILEQRAIIAYYKQITEKEVDNTKTK